MRRIIDFHVHSSFSRATSKSLDLDQIAYWSKLKGINIVSSADFTHPKWFSHIKATLHEDGSGLLTHAKYSDVKFLLATEVSCIYSHAGATRRLHHIILAPSIAHVGKINAALDARGVKRAADGRPIMGLSSKNLLELLLEIDPRIALIPAHVWTPWFAIFGSKSGYDRVEDCFEDLSDHIFALETGLSSDPAMNRALSALDKYALVSNSDAHSGPKLGREANVFDMREETYDEIISILKSNAPDRFLYTIEFFPEEGMYHYDGHRSCSVSMAPNATKKAKGICPACGKPLTVGVMHRVDNLRDRTIAEDAGKGIPFKKIIPLPEIIAEYLNVVSVGSKKVMTLYHELIAHAGNEFNLLLEADAADLQQWMPADLVEGILRMRKGEVSVTPGYDGVYGHISLFSRKKRLVSAQNRLL